MTHEPQEPERGPWSFEPLTGNGWAILGPDDEERHAEWPTDGYGRAVALDREDAAAIVQALNRGPAIDAAHLERQRAWSLATFGPGSRHAGVREHILREIAEAERDPGEWIDVVILAFDGAWRSGLEPEAIVDGVIGKQAENEARTWPDWRTQDPERPIEHVREPAAAVLETCPDCRKPDTLRLREDWAALVERGASIPVVACGSPWHYYADRHWLGAPPAGADLILQERARQIRLEGYTPEVDDQLSRPVDELAAAGASYALEGDDASALGRSFWPETHVWYPRDWAAILVTLGAREPCGVCRGRPLDLIHGPAETCRSPHFEGPCPDPESHHGWARPA